MGEEQGFGQWALLKDDVRSATCTAFKDTEVITLKKDDFLTILQPSRIKESEEFMSLLDEIDVFKNIPHTFTGELPDFSLEYVFWKGDMIFKEGTDVSGIFLLKQGELEVFLTIDLVKREDLKVNWKNIVTNENQKISYKPIQTIQSSIHN
jgi:CRP-like cAMP-binding protein